MRKKHSRIHQACREIALALVVRAFSLRIWICRLKACTTTWRPPRLRFHFACPPGNCYLSGVNSPDDNARKNPPPTAEFPAPLQGLSWGDGSLLFLFCLALFGWTMFDGRPLSLHEARLPQVSREMMQNGDWLIPRSGGRPWLERPPLPHWCEAIVSFALGQHADKVWVVRLPAVLAGSITALLCAWMAARLFGRSTGLWSGLILATSLEFWTYSGLAEDDIFLAAIVAAAMALFVSLEFPRNPLNRSRTSFFGSRPWQVLGLFAMLGLTNFAKGPLVGAAVVIAPVAVFLLATRDRNRISRYLWLWGWLVFLAITLAWPAVVYHQFKTEAIDNWKFDYHGTSQYDEPFWYYPVQVLAALAPWTPAIFFGLWQTARLAKAQPASTARFLWCWAILPILVLSIPHRKHHHYLVPSLAPWAILAALGFRDITRSMFTGPLWSRRPTFGLATFGLIGVVAIVIVHWKVPLLRNLPHPAALAAVLSVVWIGCVAAFYHGLETQNPHRVMRAIVAGLAVAFCWGHAVIPDRATQDDTLLLQRAEAAVPRDALLFIDSDLHGELDFFREGFYLRPEARLLHNLSFLRDDKIKSPQVYVLTREWKARELAQLGQVDIVDQSSRSRPSDHAKKARLSHDKFMLYRLTFDPDLQRYPAPTHISTMQAMGP